MICTAARLRNCDLTPFGFLREHNASFLLALLGRLPTIDRGSQGRIPIDLVNLNGDWSVVSSSSSSSLLGCCPFDHNLLFLHICRSFHCLGLVWNPFDALGANDGDGLDNSEGLVGHLWQTLSFFLCWLRWQGRCWFLNRRCHLWSIFNLNWWRLLL